MLAEELQQIKKDGSRTLNVDDATHLSKILNELMDIGM